MKLRSGDTIVAIATPPGTGAISIVRLSGPDAISIVEGVFRGAHKLAETPTHTIRFGKIVDEKGTVLDEVLASVFRSPHSYTGEDSVEVSCHGGMLVTRTVLEAIVKSGARQAEPGEFTKRAFLNGKLDLSQAEAVGEIIRAGSAKALQSSTEQLSGIVGEKVKAIKAELVGLCSLLEIQLDFSDEGIEVAPNAAVILRLNTLLRNIDDAIGGYRTGRIIRDGILAVIVGRPNVGKSSLFNRLLLDERSIVSHVPGTTRDFLEESIEIDGVAVRLIDTAGIRDSDDIVEVEGISRSKALVSSADVVILVTEVSDSAEILARDSMSINSDLGHDAKVILVRNKSDLEHGPVEDPTGHLSVSAMSGTGVDELKRMIVSTAAGSPSADGRVGFITSRRHVEALTKTQRHIAEAVSATRDGMTPEFVAADVRMAIDAISEITGEVTTDEILNSIFSSFCVGK